MGGNDYDGDVGQRARSSQREVFTYRGYEGGDSEVARNPEKRECHKDLNVKDKNRECRDSAEHPNTTPIFVAMDVTASRGNDAKVIYEKMPMLIGQIIMKDYVPHPTLCIAAFGDATYGDLAPIQVGQFEADNRIDDNLAKIWLEEGGGGTGQESAELMAYYAARHTILDANNRGEKGYFFFCTDEGLYPKVSKEQVKKYIGDDLPEDIDTKTIFAELQQKYNVYVIYPQKKWEDRKDDIDVEIKKRVEAAGGMYEGVDIRASLLWNNRNDLDIHIVDPCGHHIYYRAYCKNNNMAPASCGGYLDVDMNVRGDTDKPVENIRWPEGKAPKGHYKIFVQNFKFHENSYAGTEFRVEVQIGDKILQFNGKTKDRLYGEESNVPVYEFDFDPAEIVKKPEVSDKYAAYGHEVIRGQWEDLIPKENILICEDPKGIGDILLGVLALSGEKGLDDYLVDMEGRGQTPLRRNQTRLALAGLGENKTGLVKVESVLPAEKKRTGKSKRL